VGDGSELHIRHERLARDGAVERHSTGWRGALDRLAETIGQPIHQKEMRP
jgi:hypothetical protein